MKISDEELYKIKQEYNEFKKTSSYEKRKIQLEFSSFARSIIAKLLQKKSITNEDLTALIQIFGNESRSENVKKYIDSLDFDESYSEEIFNKFTELGQTGFTGRGKSAVMGLDNQQLEIIHKFLLDIEKSDSEILIRETISDFEGKDIPQVKYGVYSPWLYYLHPTICPIVAGPVKRYLKKLGWDYKSYLDAWDILKQINQFISETNYGFFDEFIWENSSNYWLFIIPRSFVEGKLWEYCRQNSIATMQYQKEREDQKSITTNIREIKKIKLGDKVVVYINNNTIGGIGEVSREFYENTSKENGFEGLFGQRIDLRWITSNFEIDFKPIKPYLKDFPKNLSLKTIHEISGRDFETIYKFVDEGMIGTDEKIDEYTQMKKLLSNKKQIILYGPPGTGKTYVASNFIKSNTSDQIYNEKQAIHYDSPKKDDTFVTSDLKKSDTSDQVYNKEISLDQKFFVYGSKHIDDLKIKELCNESESTLQIDSKINKKEAFDLIKAGDTLFIYAAGKKKKIVGIAEFVRQEDLGGQKAVFTIKDFKKINDGLTLEDLKNDSIISESEFIKKKERGNLNSFNRDAAFRLLKLSKISFEDPEVEKLEDPKIVENHELITYHEFITFHPSFSYEDFIEGLRPVNNSGQISYNVEEGVFKKLCRDAFNALMTEAKIKKEIWESTKDVPQLTKEEKEKAKKAAGEVPFYLVIDEINRGDISRIFGELITLLESDKRLTADYELITTLPYSKTKFAVPPNLYLIGTMNTADKSIALIDVALRRRFGFIEMMPDYSVLEEKLVSEDDSIQEVFNLSILALKKVNENILKTYDRDHQIGHSYLLKLKDSVSSTDAIENFCFIWYYEILPLMQEYFYDAPAKLKQAIGNEFIIVENRSFSFIDKLEGEEFIKTIQRMVNSEKRQN